MTDPVFFRLASPLTLADIVSATGAKPADGADLTRTISGVAPLDRAGPDDLVFLDNPRYAPELDTTGAAACLVSPKFASRVPEGTVALVTGQPYRAFATVSGKLFPDAMRPGSVFGSAGQAPGSFVHPAARLEAGVIVDPGAVIGPGAEIGTGTVIGANAVVGPGVRIGRQCSIGPNVTVIHALVGDRVILHPGVRVGQDGFGFALGPQGHLKVPQVGRVIIQNDVEIGANTTIDRGANRDTVIGEGTKIDNLVQIAHNVVVGRHCIIVSQVGVSGSVTIEDFVALGGQVGVVGHVRIGMGAQIAGSSNVADDVPPGARWGGTPAKPVKEWFRELTLVANLAKRKSGGGASSGDT
ncbi:UDP-3-O-(3-hydroxymyristoyl)glucosamine N-acyltransferase [Alsobacter sp. R-9]